MNNSEIENLKAVDHSKLLNAIYDDFSKEFDLRFSLKGEIE